MSVWTIIRVALKVLGMGFVVASCLMFLKQASLYRELTHNTQPLVNVGVVSLIFLNWAYHVIWKPIPPPSPRAKNLER